MEKIKAYISINPKQAVDTNTSVYLRDIGNVYCGDKNTKDKIESTKIYTSGSTESWEYMNTVDIIDKILSKNSNLDIQIMGPNEVLFEIKSKENRNVLMEIGKLIFVLVTLFLGAALGIVYFHEDVNMGDALEKLYVTLMGESMNNSLIMAIPYSIGLGVGMITFFTKLYSKSPRRKMEPGPMDIQLYLYDKDMEEYLLQDIKNTKLKE